MVYGLRMSARLGSYIARNKIAGKRRFPLVLMLEPTFRCNLSCTGCGRIRDYKDVMGREMGLEECLSSAREAGAPVVSITGGEPLLHPQISEIVDKLLGDRRFVFLCTNGLLLNDFVSSFKPHPNLSLVVHLDGLEQTHDAIAGRKGVFGRAIASIEAAKKRGYQVRTNTTIYRGTKPQEVIELFALLISLKVDGLMVTPAFNYQSVTEDIFLTKSDAKRVFSEIYKGANGAKLYNTPLYWEFLRGERKLKCSPWSNPTRNPKGWKSPCYLLTDAHYASFQELMERTDWLKYENGDDPRCDNCMLHSGFEASAILSAHGLSDLWKLVKWNIFS